MDDPEERETTEPKSTVGELTEWRTPFVTLGKDLDELITTSVLFPKTKPHGWKDPYPEGGYMGISRSHGPEATTDDAIALYPGMDQKSAQAVDDMTRRLKGKPLRELKSHYRCRGCGTSWWKAEAHNRIVRCPKCQQSNAKRLNKRRKKG
jgi:DNA-directed RNA polymerase subunit RPC12/RpoP